MKKNSTGFTLVEMLVVIAVIAILAGLILPALKNSREQGRMIQCMNNMRNLALTVNMYRDDFHANAISNPPWLSTLYGRSGMGTKAVYLCPDDRVYNGTTVPRFLLGDLNNDHSKDYPETADNDNNAVAQAQFLAMRNPEIHACSYLYEFSMAQATWGWVGTIGGGVTVANVDLNGDNIASWTETKIYQMEHGDLTQLCADGVTACPHPYTVGDFAMIRCFWHMKSPDGGRKEVMNIAYDTRAFKSGVTWQKTSSVD